MVSRVLTRSKALAHALSCADAAAPSLLYGVRPLCALSTLLQNPAVTAAPSQRQTSVCSPLNFPKILGYEQSSLLTGTQVSPRWFSAGASNGYFVQQESASTKVMALSPLEATITKPIRSRPLTSESLKVRLTKLATGATYVMIISQLCF